MKKNTLIMLGVFVVLLIIVLLSENPFKSDEKKSGPPLFAGFDSAAVSVIEIYSATDTTRMEKADGLWRVKTQDDYPADSDAIGQMLVRIRDMERGEVASRNPEKRSLFEVDGSNLHARYLGADGNVLGHLYVGKSGPGYSGSYVRTEGSDEVILVSGYLRSVFDKGPRGWRDRTIVDIDQNAVLWFTMDRGDTVITARTEDKIRWYLSGPDSVEAKMNMVDNVLRTFAALMADDFADDASMEDTGLDDPWATFHAHLEDGTDLRLLVGDEDEGSRWVKRPDQDMIFKIRDFRVNNLFPSFNILRELTEEEIQARQAD
jgi:hypothetical protein